MDIDKTLLPFCSTKKIPCVAATVMEICFLPSNSQVHCNNLHNRLTVGSQSNLFLFKDVLPLSSTKSQIIWFFFTWQDLSRLLRNTSCKYLGTHSKTKNRPLVLRLIPTSLYRDITTIHVVWNLHKRRLIKLDSGILVAQSDTEVECFKLVEALLRIHSCSLPHRMISCCLPLSEVNVSLHNLKYVCVQQSHATNTALTTVTWSEPFTICCHVIGTQ